jgi:lipopolysaccharide heptosyltransferase II
MLPPLFLSVRVPTLLASLWRSLFSERPGDGLPQRGPLSIIIFRLDAMGDVVMTTPLFRELKRAFPKSHCTAVVQCAIRPLLVTNPHIDEILTPPRVRLPLVPRRAKELVAAILLYWRCLRRRRFDIAISPRWDLDEHLATLLCLLTNASRRVGYTEKASPLKQQLNRGFDTAFSICLPAGPVRHEVVRNLVVLEALGGTVQDSRLEVHITERDRAFALRLLATVPASTMVIALGIGATSAGRRWPLERYAECISRLTQSVRARPVIVCSASEREQGLRLEELLNCESILLCGAPLREVCAVLERCDLFIGNDSGAAHLAAAMDCRTIVVSRHPQNGDPNHANSPLRFGPYCREACVVQPATGLDGCNDCCSVPEAHCITAVSVDDVVGAARVLLSNDPAAWFHRESAKAATYVREHQEVLLAAITRPPDGMEFGGTLKGHG